MKAIEKLSEYMDFVENLPEGFSLSRGQNADYPLLPSALRKDKKGNKKFTRQSISSFINQFKVNSHNFMPSPWDIKNDYEWMIYAQHYGIPTRLLDFTYSHIISLMFAVENSFTEENTSDDSVVWFLNPFMLNLQHCGRAQLISISSEQLRLDDFDGPIVIQGRKLNERINAQNGVFIYFQDTENSLESIVTGNEVLRKLVIKGEYRKAILSSCKCSANPPSTNKIKRPESIRPI